jgi:uncharacterized protein YegP (UPF0339 family)
VTPVTETVSSINYKTNTITCASENTYEQSGIVDLTNMYNDVTDMAKNASYNLYLDKYGYVRAYIEAAYGDYVLLTEMYRDTTDRNNLIKDGTYTVETVAADGNVANYTVANVAGVTTFYAGKTDYNLLSGNGLTKAVKNSSWTNVADSAIDGETINLASVAKTYRYDSGNVSTYIQALTDEVVSAGEITKGQRRFYFDKNGVTDYANITSNTIVYLVYGTNESSLTKVEVGTGYNAIPAIGNTTETINSVYAVVTDTYADSKKATYPVADVLVIEIQSSYTKDFVLGYEQYTNTVDAILSDGTTDDVAIADGAAYKGINFYELINGELTNSAFTYGGYITSGEVDQVRKLLDYVDFYAYTNGDIETDVKKVSTLAYDEDLPVYTLSANGKGIVSAKSNTVETLKAGDEIIVVWKDARHSAPAYILNVTGSNGLLDTVFETYKGTKPVEDTSYADAKAAAEKALAANTAAGQDADKKADAAKALAAAEKDLKAIDPKDLTGEEAAERAELLAKLATAISSNKVQTKLISTNEQVVVIDETNKKWIPVNKAATSLQQLTNALSDTAGFGVEIVAKDTYGDDITDGSTKLSAITTLTVLLKDQYGDAEASATYTENSGTFYTVAFVENHVTVTTADGTALSNGDSVLNGTVLTVAAKTGYKVTTVLTNGKLTVSGSNVTISSAKYTENDAATELLAEAVAKLDTFTLTDIINADATELTEAKVKAALKKQVEDAIDMADVTASVAFGAAYSAPSQAGDKVTPSVTVTITAKSGVSGTASNNTKIASQSVNVILAKTAAAIKAQVAGEIPAAVTYGASDNASDWTKFKAAIAKAISDAAIDGVTNFTVTNETPATYAVNNVYKVTYSFQYNGETITDSAEVTVNAGT